MKVTAYLSDGGVLNIGDFDAESALDLKQELNEGGPDFLTFDMDGATVIVARPHVVRMDFETG